MKLNPGEYRALVHANPAPVQVIVSRGFSRQRGKRTLYHCVIERGADKGRVMWVDSRMIQPLKPVTPRKRGAAERRRDSQRKARAYGRLAQGGTATGSDTDTNVQVIKSGLVSQPLRKSETWVTVTCSCGNTWEALNGSPTVNHCGQCTTE